jgi:superfamily II DNA or RNA helicase
VTLLADQTGLGDANAYASDLWVNRGESADEVWARSTFTRLFERYANSEISFGQYRHVAKHFANLCGVETSLYPDLGEVDDPADDLDPDIYDGYISQFGHSRQVSDRTYALVAGEHPRIRGNYLENFRRMSFKWHELLTPSSAIPRTRRAPDLPARNRGTGPRDIDIQVHDAEVHPAGVITVDFDLEPLPVRLRGNLGQQTAIIGSNYTSNSPRWDVDVLLKSLTGDDDATFRSKAQRQAAEYILNVPTNMILVLPTGLGKSTLMLLVAFADRSSSQLVVIPTLSLRTDLEDRVSSQGLTVATDIDDFRGQNILLLTPEALARRETILQVLELAQSRSLTRIFIDEAHLVCTDSHWRPAYLKLPFLGIAGLPMILMTGTCPNYVERELVERFFSPSSYPVIIRQSTNRLNIAYAVERWNSEDEALDSIRDAIIGANAGIDSKVIVYLPSRDATTSLSNILCMHGINAVAYHGEMDDALRRASYLEWKSGRKPVMVATSAFGVGIDDRSVGLVILYGLPYSLLDLLQQAGRAGRDGRASRALILFSLNKEQNRVRRCQELAQREQLVEVLDFATMDNVCRRRVLSRYIDGDESSCRDLVGSQACDICSRGLVRSGSVVARATAGNVHPGPASINGLPSVTSSAPSSSRPASTSVPSSAPPSSMPAATSVPLSAPGTSIAASAMVSSASVDRTQIRSLLNRPTQPGVVPAITAQGALGRPSLERPGVQQAQRNDPSTTASRVSGSMPSGFTTIQSPLPPSVTTWSLAPTPGSKGVARNMLQDQNAGKADLKTILDSLDKDKICGACFANSGKRSTHLNGTCDLALGRCQCCYAEQTGPNNHSTMSCQYRKTKFPDVAVCFRCYRKNDDDHIGELGRCNHSRFVKEFFLFASSHPDKFPGLEKGVLKSGFFQIFESFLKNNRG